MKRKQLHDIAAQIQSTYNSRHPYDDMHIVAEVEGSEHAWISITPWQMRGHLCESIYWPEDIIPFAHIYGLSVQCHAHYDYEQGKPIPCICLFPPGKIED